jgi:hypothetical protein
MKTQKEACVCGIAVTPPMVRKTPLFAPVIYKVHRFAKTGSGQT